MSFCCGCRVWDAIAIIAMSLHAKWVLGAWRTLQGDSVGLVLIPSASWMQSRSRAPCTRAAKE